MTQIEKQSLWIKQQRSKVLASVNKVVSILFLHNLNLPDNARYGINLDISTSGNDIDIRIYDMINDNALVEHIEHYCLSSIFNNRYSYSFAFDEKEIGKNVDQFLVKMKDTKRIISKYSKLNLIK